MREGFKGSVRAAAGGIGVDAGFWDVAVAADFCVAALAGGVEDLMVRDGC
jgi:hypothetical protein